jgi:hypothetical protein
MEGFPKEVTLEPRLKRSTCGSVLIEGTAKAKVGRQEHRSKQSLWQLGAPLILKSRMLLGFIREQLYILQTHSGCVVPPYLYL